MVLFSDKKQAADEPVCKRGISMQQVDIIIPVYRPTGKLFTLLDRLMEQTIPVNKIYLINTEQKYFDALIAGTNFWKKYKKVNVKHIAKREFDHGYTRRRAVKESESPYFVMMTDDALPADRTLLEKLLQPLWEKKAGVSYARQLPAEDCGVIETYTRAFNYPEQSCIKSAKDLNTMGIKAFFASNVCAAYDRSIYEEAGGFVKKTIFNEDMILARKVIEAGHQIAYVAEAQVIHSHNYSGIQQLKRNFDLGVSHTQFPEVFGDVKSESEGIRLVKKTCGYLLSVKKPWLIVKLVWQSGCKYIGYFLGRRYQKLPEAVVKKCSMNRNYWK